MRRRVVKGYCPSCGARALALTAEGLVICLYPACERPTAATEILDEGNDEHVVQISRDDFTLQHPLRERLDGALFDCGMQDAIAASDGPPAAPGRYLVAIVPERMIFVPIHA